MKTNNTSRSAQRKSGRGARQRGMSLVETMVGLTLGVVVSFIITQVWGNFEGQKQRSVSGTSAQESGLLALTELEQDIRSAGAGFTDSAALDCTNTFSYYDDGTTQVSPAPGFGGGMSMVPVRIIDGGTGSDTLTVKRGADFLGAIPASITKPMPPSSSELNVNNVTGFEDNDIVLAMSASGNCTVMQVTQVQPSPHNLQHNPGGTTTYNPPPSFQNANGWPGYVKDDKVMKIGKMLAYTYAVNASNQLTLTDLNLPIASATSVLAPDIVKIKAQYGIAPALSQDVNDWVNATAASGWDTLDKVKVKRIKAIRLVVVARSAKREGNNVTTPCTNVSGTVNNGPCAWSDSANDPAPVIDLSSDADWQRYRYRVYQTIIPIRNIIWAGV